MARRIKTLSERYQDYVKEYQRRAKRQKPEYEMFSEAKFSEIWKNRRQNLKRLKQSAITEEDRRSYANRLKNVTRDVVESQYITQKRVDRSKEGLNEIYVDIVTGNLEFDDSQLGSVEEFVKIIGDEGLTKNNYKALFTLLNDFMDNDVKDSYWY